GPDRVPDGRGPVLRGPERLEHEPGLADPRRGRDTRPRPSHVSPGLVFRGGAGATVARDRRGVVPGGGRTPLHALHRVLVPSSTGDRDQIGLHRRGRLRALTYQDI